MISLVTCFLVVCKTSNDLPLEFRLCFYVKQRSHNDHVCSNFNFALSWRKVLRMIYSWFWIPRHHCMHFYEHVLLDIDIQPLAWIPIVIFLWSKVLRTNTSGYSTTYNLLLELRFCSHVERSSKNERFCLVNDIDTPAWIPTLFLCGGKFSERTILVR